MSKSFCTNCGKPLGKNHSHCVECGAKQEPAQNSRVVAQPETKPPLSKKRKALYSVIAGILVLFGAFYLWGSSHVSAENTAKRFTEALQEKDAAALRKVSIVKPGDLISKPEAQALVALYQEDSDEMNEELQAMMAQSPAGLFTVMENGRWLGIFKRYSVQLQPQYAALDVPFEEIVTTFNGKEIPVFEKDEEDDISVYGPMAPGIYKLESTYDGEYTKVTSSGKMTLDDADSSRTYHSIEMDASYVDLWIDRDVYPYSKAYIKAGEKEIPFDEDGYIENFGPVHLDGSTSVVPFVEMPWGKVESGAIKLKDREVDIDPLTINKKLSDSLSELLLKYGEEYVQANAAWDPSLFTTVTGEMKESVRSDIEGYRDNEMFYSGQLDAMAADFDGVTYEESEAGLLATVPVLYTFRDDSYYEGNSPSPAKRTDSANMELIYHSKDKSWKINRIKDFWFDEDDWKPTVTLDGSKKMYNPTGKTAAASKSTDGDAEAALSDFMRMYNMASVAAINDGDFSFVQEYLSPDGPRYNEQKKYIDDLYSREITEDVISTELESVNEKGNGAWEVVTLEKFNIHHPDSSSTKTFRTTNLIKKIDGAYQLHELVSTKEI